MTTTSSAARALHGYVTIQVSIFPNPILASLPFSSIHITALVSVAVTVAVTIAAVMAVAFVSAFTILGAGVVGAWEYSVRGRI